MVTKRDDPNYAQVSGHVPRDLLTDFNILCAGRNITKSEALEEAIRLFLAQAKPKPTAALEPIRYNDQPIVLGICQLEHIQVSRESSHSTAKLWFQTIDGEKRWIEEAVGNGTIDAASNAVEQAARKCYSVLPDCQTVFDAESDGIGTAGMAKVKVGVRFDDLENSEIIKHAQHTDIVLATVFALIQALNDFLQNSLPGMRHTPADTMEDAGDADECLPC